MSTLVATPATIGAVAARKFLAEVTDPCYHGPRHPLVESAMAWNLARYGNNAEYWKMAMIQLMVQARRQENPSERLKLWSAVGRYFLDEASPSQLQEDVLWHFLININANMTWMIGQIVGLRLRVRRLGRSQNEIAVAA